jgi:hypothetical protein
MGQVAGSVRHIAHLIIYDFGRRIRGGPHLLAKAEILGVRKGH